MDGPMPGWVPYFCFFLLISLFVIGAAIDKVVRAIWQLDESLQAIATHLKHIDGQLENIDSRICESAISNRLK